MGESRSSPNRVRAALRHREFLGLRAEGLTFQAIGERLGVSKTRARQIVDKELERVRAVTAEEAVALKRRQLEEYQALKRAWWPMAAGEVVEISDDGPVQVPPDKDAAGVVLKAMAQEARLAGLDSPEKKITADLGPLGDMSEAEVDAELARHAHVFKIGGEA